jgi:hypothetical protein
MPEWKRFRGKPLPYKDRLDEIFTGTAADGSHSQQADILSQIDPTLLGFDEGVEGESPPCTSGPQKGIGWEAEDPEHEVLTENMRVRASFESQSLTSVTVRKRAASAVAVLGGKKTKRTVQDSINDLVNIIDRRDSPIEKPTQRHIAI